MAMFELSDQQRFLLSLIATSAMDTNELAKKLGCSRKAAQNRCQVLRKRGYIECIRSSKTYVWCMPEQRELLSEELREKQRLTQLTARREFLRKKAEDNRQRRLQKLIGPEDDDRPFVHILVQAKNCAPITGLVRSVFELAA
jgi:biotin operon repressor